MCVCAFSSSIIIYPVIICNYLVSYNGSQQLAYNMEAPFSRAVGLRAESLVVFVVFHPETIQLEAHWFIFAFLAGSFSTWANPSIPSVGGMFRKKINPDQANKFTPMKEV